MPEKGWYISQMGKHRLKHRIAAGETAICGRRNCDVYYDVKAVNCPDCLRMLEDERSGHASVSAASTEGGS